MTVNCSNAVSYDYDTLVVKSRLPIINLRFDKTGALRSESSFTITWFTDAGTVALSDWIITMDGVPGLTVDSWDQLTYTGQSSVSYKTKYAAQQKF